MQTVRTVLQQHLCCNSTSDILHGTVEALHTDTHSLYSLHGHWLCA